MKYIIGDVHGCFDTLMALIAKLPDGTKEEDIIFVGDLTDRGPKNRDVVNYVRNSNHLCIMGNHEELMFNAIDNMINHKTPIYLSDWSPNGGHITYAEYEDDRDALIRDKDWMKTLPRYLHLPDEKDKMGRELVVSHAPCLDFFEDLLEKQQDEELVRLSKIKRKPDEPIHKRQMEIVGLRRLEENIIWNRRIPRYEDTKYFNVFGHNIISNFIFNPSGQLKIPREVITPENTLFDSLKGYAAIDTGCFVKRSESPFNGKLSCLEFPTMRIIQQVNMEEVK